MYGWYDLYIGREIATSSKQMTTFILRIKNGRTYDVAEIDLPVGTSLEAATEIVINELGAGQRLERITNPVTGESASLASVSRRPAAKGFA